MLFKMIKISDWNELAIYNLRLNNYFYRWIVFKFTKPIKLLLNSSKELRNS
jgi:hypothetical protein